jgi:hypothetical protein
VAGTLDAHPFVRNHAGAHRPHRVSAWAGWVSLALFLVLGSPGVFLRAKTAPDELLEFEANLVLMLPLPSSER